MIVGQSGQILDILVQIDAKRVHITPQQRDLPNTT